MNGFLQIFLIYFKSSKYYIKVMATSFKKPKICFFDSGIGGLTLLYECVRKLPCAEYVYFADNYNVPYGSLSEDKLLNKADGVFRQISLLKPSAAVIACNTVTARCAGYLREKYDFPILGIQPAIKPAAAAGSCAVLATPATADSWALKELAVRCGMGRTEVLPCPELALYIENNIYNIDKEKINALLPETRADSIVLGCTHYSFVKKHIEKYYSRPVFDGNLGTAEHLRTFLGNFDHRPENTGKIWFCGGDEKKNSHIFNNIETILK